MLYLVSSGFCKRHTLTNSANTTGQLAVSPYLSNGHMVRDKVVKWRLSIYPLRMKNGLIISFFLRKATTGLIPTFIFSRLTSLTFPEQMTTLLHLITV